MSQELTTKREDNKDDEDMEDFYDPMIAEEYPEDNSKQHTKRLSVLCDI